MEEVMTTDEESNVALLTRRFRKFYCKNKPGSIDDKFKGKKPNK